MAARDGSAATRRRWRRALAGAGVGLALAACAAGSREAPRVDVTGHWAGTWAATEPAASGTLRLVVIQKGADVTGQASSTGFPTRTPDGALVGTVRGDRFSFRTTSGAAAGEFTVSGSEMSGRLLAGITAPATLRRQ